MKMNTERRNRPSVNHQFETLNDEQRLRICVLREILSTENDYKDLLRYINKVIKYYHYIIMPEVCKSTKYSKPGKEYFGVWGKSLFLLLLYQT